MLRCRHRALQLPLPCTVELMSHWFAADARLFAHDVSVTNECKRKAQNQKQRERGVEAALLVVYDCAQLYFCVFVWSPCLFFFFRVSSCTVKFPTVIYLSEVSVASLGRCRAAVRCLRIDSGDNW